MICIAALTLIIHMLTRANRNLLRRGGSNGNEDPWRNASGDLAPCDPSNSLQGKSSAWIEKNQDLVIRDGATSDAYWTVSGGDISPSL